MTVVSTQVFFFLSCYKEFPMCKVLCPKDMRKALLTYKVLKLETSINVKQTSQYPKFHNNND